MRPETRTLIELAREADGPTAANRQRVRVGLATALTAGTASGGAGAAAGGTAAAGAVGPGAAAAGSGTAAAGVGTAGAGAGILAGGKVAWILVGSTLSLAAAGGVVSGFAARNSPGARGPDRARASASLVKPSASSLASRSLTPSRDALPSAQQRGAPVVVDGSTQGCPSPGGSDVGEGGTEPSSLPAKAHGQSRVPADSVSLTPAKQRSLRAELDVLRRAHRALEAGDHAEAMHLLDACEVSDEAAALEEEREGARVLAQCGQDDGAREARAAGQRFLQRYPASLLGPRVRAACNL